MNAIVGLDFDNTLVTYDDLFHRLARERHLIDASVPPVKRHVRDVVRRRADGERAWQQLQADAYGPLMAGASIIPGVAQFLMACRARNLRVYIISHRTERASLDRTGTDLRAAAFAWMQANGFFDPAGLGLAEDRIFFESTRATKVSRIGEVGCTHFVDDLEEVFADPDFPPSVERILFSESIEAAGGLPYSVCRDWPAIEEAVFHGRR